LGDAEKRQNYDENGGEEDDDAGMSPFDMLNRGGRSKAKQKGKDVSFELQVASYSFLLFI
jgi:hypothetical protein